MLFMKPELREVRPRRVASAAVTPMVSLHVGANADHLKSSPGVLKAKHLHLGNTEFLSLKGTSLDQLQMYP